MTNIISATHDYAKVSQTDDATRNLETQLQIQHETGSGKSTSSPAR